MTLQAVAQGWGNQLYLFNGGQIDIVARDVFIDEDGAATPLTFGQVNVDTASDGDFHKSLFGGHNSFYPGGYSNHKPMAFLGKSRLITATNIVKDGRRNLYILGFDGSGLFFNKGGKFETDPWRTGKGNELFSPSGQKDTQGHDVALLRHNDHVFGCGAYTDVDASTDTDWNNLGWHYHFDDPFSVTETQRTYRMFSIRRDPDDRIFGPAIKFEPDALSQNHLMSCDMTAFRTDLYYANWVDVLRWPGASGTPEIVHHDRNNPRARIFGSWPSGGFSAGEPVGENELLMLQSDGLLHRLSLTGSGTNLLVDFEDVKTDYTSRDSDNLFARSNSTTNEPGRTPLLLPFNDELHAFVTTQTSGYIHMTCGGAASGTGNWTDRTTALPPSLQRADGCLYGFVDGFRNKMMLMHVSYSKFGLFGTTGGGQNAGGGMWMYLHDPDRNWIEVWRGNIGLPPRGFMPYANIGPYAAMPSGNNPQLLKCSDHAVLTYQLFDELSRDVNVDVEWSNDLGASWNSARRFKSYDRSASPLLLGSGTQNLSTSRDGVEYTFFWDYVNDIQFNPDPTQEILLRVRPALVR
jgi:hypothetical protein